MVNALSSSAIILNAFWRDKSGRLGADISAFPHLEFGPNGAMFAFVELIAQEQERTNDVTTRRHQRQQITDRVLGRFVLLDVGFKSGELKNQTNDKRGNRTRDFSNQIPNREISPLLAFSGGVFIEIDDIGLHGTGQYRASAAANAREEAAKVNVKVIASASKDQAPKRRG